MGSLSLSWRFGSKDLPSMSVSSMDTCRSSRCWYSSASDSAFRIMHIANSASSKFLKSISLLWTTCSIMEFTSALKEHRPSVRVTFASMYKQIIIIIYSCCCRSAYAIDHAPTDAGGACKTSSQRTRARTTRDHTILITIQFLLPSLPYQ